ncbi:MAG: NnrS family protein [Candidatus Eremiobacteraeota bacterium]|nr:NnrS family protein [Candidatus Eremiobacteraeota bacterium]
MEPKAGHLFFAPHRAFIGTSLCLAAGAGTPLGLWMALVWAGWATTDRFSSLLAAHGQLQVYGFVCLYTMGVAMMVLPGTLKATLQPRWLAFASLVLMLTGIAANSASPNLLGAVLESGSVIAYLFVLGRTRRSAKSTASTDTLSRQHAFFLATGSLWLLACPWLALLDSTRALETVLWGFAGLHIAGIGLRIHPSLLGIKGIQKQWLLPSAICWNVGLLLFWLGPEGLWSWFLALGVGCFLWALRPFRRPRIGPGGGAWVRYYIQTSYLGLFLAVCFTCATASGYPTLAGAARHLLATGFVIMMMVGMGLRMIPAYETRRLPWRSGPWAIYFILVLGTAVRVTTQALYSFTWLAVGAVLQTVAIVLFACLTLGMYAFGQTVVCEQG